MHTAEEVRKDAEIIASGLAFPNAALKLLAYADLLEAMEWFHEGCDGDSFAVKMIRQRAAEKQKARQG